MRKIFTTLFILTGFCTRAFSQTESNVEFGVNIGYNAANVAVDPYITNYAFRNGFNLGISANYYFSTKWSLEGKLNYDQKGWNNGYFVPSNGAPVGTNYNLDYVTVPLLACWHFGKTSNWYLYYGPYAGFLLSAKETHGNTDLKEAFNGLDIGGEVGLGVKFPIANKLKLFLESDLQAGSSPIFKGDSYNEIYGTDARNYRLSINFGVNFSLQ